MIGDNLKELRKLRNIKACEMAHKLGVAKITYYKWESNERDIPLNKLKTLCSILDVSVDYLLKYDDIKPTFNEFIHNFESYAERHMTENSMYIIDYLSKQWDGDFEALVLMAGAYASLPPQIRKDISALCLYLFNQTPELCNPNLLSLIDTKKYQLSWNKLADKT